MKLPRFLVCFFSLMTAYLFFAPLSLASEVSKEANAGTLKPDEKWPTAISTIKQELESLQKKTSLAMHGEAAMQGDWSHLPYVNPKAPKGGHLSLPSIGTFDSLNQFISKGTPAAGLGLLYDTLTEASIDEPFTVYGLVAESFQVAQDRSWIVFQLNPEARFHDKHTIDAEDVVFTFNTLVAKGKPLFQLQYMDIEDVSALNKHEVLFRFKHGNNKELPLIIGQLPILPAHYWQDKTFDAPTLEAPLGSGPYMIEKANPGKNIQFKRVKDHWAKNHPLHQGRFNFDIWTQEYFAESNIALEAFKTGEYNLRAENNSKFWATSYTGPAIDKKQILKTEIPIHQPVGMQGFIYNTRKPMFKDPILREALAYAFNFNWSNNNLFYGQYKRSRSFFENTELAASGLPSANELKLLNPLKDQVPARVFTQAYNPPSVEGKSGLRKNLRVAKKLLQNAGYTLKDKQLFSPKNEKVTFEILLHDTGFERIVLPFVQNLKILGIEVEPRRVDVNQYIERVREFNYDIIVSTFMQSLSPGNEQRNYWHSSAADQRDSRNLSGIKNPAVDILIEKIVQSQNRDELITATRALDRVLQWSFIVIPNWHVNYERIAYWPPITLPEKHPKYNIDITSWWVTP